MFLELGEMVDNRRSARSTVSENLALQTSLCTVFIAQSVMGYSTGELESATRELPPFPLQLKNSDAEIR